MTDLSYGVAAPVACLPRPRPPIVRPGRAWIDLGIPLLLLALSIITTAAIGARFMHNFRLGQPAVASDNDLWPWPWLFEHPARFALGLPFSATLLSILLTHEFGHYLACRAHRIRATLPWVLPAPTLSGTAGAVIQVQGRIPTRQALVDLGAYGPLAGYLVSLLAIAFGLTLSRPAPANAASGMVGFGEPLTIRILAAALHAPDFHHTLLHPILIAGWIGLFVTALNLIPGGQLDGGHLLHAFSPNLHKWTTRLLPVLLIALGIFLWIGWILWAIVLLIPILRRHPNVPPSGPLGPARILACLLSLAVFLLTFAAEPFLSSSLIHYFR